MSADDMPAESTNGPIFISHTSADDAFVKALREALEAHQHPVWVDSRKLRGGAKLAPEITAAIEAARQFIAVLSPNTINSPWVRREITQALAVEQRRQDDGYRVIPLLLPGLTPAALENWFDEEPVAVPIQLRPGGLAEAMPAILAALGERLPTDHEPTEQPEARPLEELVLTLSDPKIDSRDGKRRISATAALSYEPATPAARRVDSRRYTFTAPLGPIEADDLRWYLEQYFLWPVGVFATRAKGIEQRLPEWGQDLFRAALGAAAAHDALAAWQHAADGAERRFSVQVDSDLPDGAAPDAQSAANEAATELLALPWELLHDGRAWLFQGGQPTRVRRRLPNREAQPARPTRLPIRILLLSPRPEHDGKGNAIGYIDHRASALPLVEAVERLGELVELSLLAPPTYAALDQALQAAADRQAPFDVVHFDGHGVFDRRVGLGGLCFEDPKDAGLPANRAMEFIDAQKLAGLFRRHRIPLVCLEACQSARAELDPTASVAARLLEEGVASVVAMSHSVLVETSRRFVQAFYGELARGARVGGAMLAGQRALYGDTWRGKVLGAGELRLQDWFVPVIYQEEQDPQLITRIPSEQVSQLAARQRRLSLGDVPAAPAHGFRGRSRELLALERQLHAEPFAVLRGIGGAGKTALAAELAHWLTRSGRCERAAFVSLERHRDVRAVLDSLGHQLFGMNNYSVAQFADMDRALQPVERALADHATLVVFDNCESVLPLRALAGDQSAEGGLDEALAAIASLCRRLLDAHPHTRLVFTSRESLPAPFDRHERELGALDRHDAIELVAEVMKQNGWTPPATDPGGTPREIEELVDAVNRHARALVLLAREVARSGVRATTADLRGLMAELERKHPGDRENSLYASVELSLRRLSVESRERIKVLGVCQGGVTFAPLMTLTGLEGDDVRRLGGALIGAGLAEDAGHFHLRLDPGLAPVLLGGMSADEAETTRTRWAEAMAPLAYFLHEQRSEDSQLSAQLTLLEIPNLLAMLQWIEGRWPPERVVELADTVEDLVADLGRPQALAVATRVRERAAGRLGDWSHARYLTESSSIVRLLERGELPVAHEAAQRLLQRCLAAGESAYPGADYDLAQAHVYLGRVLMRGGGAEVALAPLAEAQRRFQRLADAGNASAAGMASAAINETVDCLCDLGRLDEAAAANEENIRRGEKRRDRRQVALSKDQLGSVRMLQKRYAEALAIYAEARDTFAALGEPRTVATIWHQIGNVHLEAGQFEAAEQAHRQSLAIKVRENDLAGQASSLGSLGLVYDAMGRLEEAVSFYRQCAELYVQDLANEGLARANLAHTLIKLCRHDQARQELERAIECKKPYGHAAEPWTTWSILEDLERATGHAEAAQAARQQAIQTYLAYRRAGGVSQSNRAQFFDFVALAIRQNAQGDAARQLNGLLEANDPPPFTTLIAKLQSILAGNRDPALAADPELYFRDVAELLLLLEALPA